MFCFSIYYWMFSFHTDDNGHEIDIEVAEIDGYVHKS